MMTENYLDVLCDKCGKTPMYCDCEQKDKCLTCKGSGGDFADCPTCNGTGEKIAKYKIPDTNEERTEAAVDRLLDKEKKLDRPEFKRYGKYEVMKLEDINKFLLPTQKWALDDIVATLQIGRKAEGKVDCNSYVVVNEDEPYAEQVWALIQRHCEGNKLDSPREKIDELLRSEMVTIGIDIDDAKTGQMWAYDSERLSKRILALIEPPDRRSQA